MKKNLIVLSSLLAFSIMVPSFAFDNNVPPQMQAPSNVENCDCFHMKKPPISKEEMEKKKESFEKRLNLTEEQKQMAKKMREEGREKMKPLFEAMKAKHEELNVIKNEIGSKEEVQKIQNDLKELHKKIHEQKMKNMKEFESILNKKQLKELEKMKEEGRKKFENSHKNCKCKPECRCKHEHIRPVMPPPVQEKE